MKNFFLYIVAIVISFPAYGVPAFPFRTVITDGVYSKNIFMRGDENCKYAITEEGYVCVQGKNDWYYASKKKDGTFDVSEIKVLSLQDNMSQIKEFYQKSLNYEQIDTIEQVSKAKPENALMLSKSTIMSEPIIGKRKILVVLVEFPDCKLTKTINDFNNLFNKEAYDEDGAMGSVYDYYKRVSYNKLELESTIIGVYEAEKEMSYYGSNTLLGGNDKNTFALFQEVLIYAKANINMEQFDCNQDGYIDNIHIIYAGHGEEAGASSNTIWAHESSFVPIKVGNKYIDRYSCSPELRGASGNGITRIGPPCHEIGHALGANDYYDTDYNTGGNYEGTGQWDIMASGSWNNNGISPADFNPYVKTHDFKWTEDILLDEKHAPYVFCKENDIYRINTKSTNDYFLLQYTKSEYISDIESCHGLKIFHIGPDIENCSIRNNINSTYPQQCYIVDASSVYESPIGNPVSYGKINDKGCLFPGTSINTEFSQYSVPNTTMINGGVSGFSIMNIQERNDGVSFVYLHNGKTQDEENIWNDSFEGFFLAGEWKSQSISGGTNWNLRNYYQSSYDENTPVAYKGIGVICLENMTSRYTDAIADFIRTPYSFDGNINYRISFHTWINSANPTQDSISVILRCGNLDKTIYSFKSNESKKWQNHNIGFRSNEKANIVFRGYVSNGTRMMIDDISLNIDKKNRIPGDVDCDGIVSMSDANIIVNDYLNGNAHIEKDIADVNGDGLVTMADVNIIVNMYLGK